MWGAGLRGVRIQSTRVSTVGFLRLVAPHVVKRSEKKQLTQYDTSLQGNTTLSSNTNQSR